MKFWVAYSLIISFTYIELWKPISTRRTKQLESHNIDFVLFKYFIYFLFFFFGRNELPYKSKKLKRNWVIFYSVLNSHLSLAGSPGQSSSPAAPLHHWWRPAWGFSDYWSSVWSGSGHRLPLETNTQQRLRTLCGPDIEPAAVRSHCRSLLSAQRSRNRPAHGCSGGGKPAWRGGRAGRQRWRRCQWFGRWRKSRSCWWSVCEPPCLRTICRTIYVCSQHSNSSLWGLFVFPSDVFGWISHNLFRFSCDL